LLALGAVAGALSVPTLAHAGGYDTPMLYSARHMGMGGAAIGYVNDPSALFHNPAGLGQVAHGEVLGDFSLLVGGLHAGPSFLATDVDSDRTVAPFFLVGGAYRVHDLITLGLGVYPVASAGATYHYGTPVNTDRTELFFLETSPAIALNLARNFRVGVGYRVTYVRVNRYQSPAGSPATTDFTLGGASFAGFRIGAQYTALPWLQFGVVYRNPTTTKVTNSHGVAIGKTFSDVSTKFTLPSKLGAGTRADLDEWNVPLSFAFDFEYDFNKQNKGDPLLGTDVASGTPTSVPNLFEWKNSYTLRFGTELRFLHDTDADLDRVAARIGYVFDSETANPNYPTPFGTPPAPTHVLTAGTGYNGGNWQANLAYAYRFGHGPVSPSAQTPSECPFCGYAGKKDYAIYLSGFYADVSYKF